MFDMNQLMQMNPQQMDAGVLPGRAPGKPPPQKQPGTELFSNLPRVIEIIQKNPEKANEAFVNAARSGIRPPPWRDVEGLYNAMMEMQQPAQVSQRQQVAFNGPVQPTVPQMQMPMSRGRATNLPPIKKPGMMSIDDLLGAI